MKQSLAILVVIALVATIGRAQYVSMPQFQPTKDAFLLYDSPTGTPYVDPAYYGRGVCTRGNEAYGRAGHSTQDRFIMEFDRAAILDSASTLLGRPVTPDDLLSGSLVMAMRLTAADDTIAPWTPTWYYPAYFTSTTAWQSEDRASWSYVDGTDANNPIDLPSTTAWNGGVNQSSLGQVPRGDVIPGTTGCVRDCPWYVDTSVSPVYWSNVGMPACFTLSPKFAAGYLFNPLNAYISMCAASNVPGSGYPATSNHGYCYSKESIENSPLLYLPIPEPATLSLLVVGAVAVLRRRK